MTVGELIEQLKTLDPSMLVVLSRDEEGNGYTELFSVDNSCAFWDGEVALRELTPELESKGYCEEDVAGPEYTPCVVLSP